MQTAPCPCRPKTLPAAKTLLSLTGTIVFLGSASGGRFHMKGCASKVSSSLRWLQYHGPRSHVNSVSCPRQICGRSMSLYMLRHHRTNAAIKGEVTTCLLVWPGSCPDLMRSWIGQEEEEGIFRRGCAIHTSNMLRGTYHLQQTTSRHAQLRVSALLRNHQPSTPCAHAVGATSTALSLSIA